MYSVQYLNIYNIMNYKNVIDYIIKNIKPKIDQINKKTHKKINYKSKKGKSVDPFTYFDVKIEKIITDLIKKKYPSHSIIGEEGKDKITDSNFKWVLDPIDGTKALVLGLPTWSNLIGFCIANKPTLGFANFPMLNKYYFSDGKKTYIVQKNKKKSISCNVKNKKKNSLVVNSIQSIKNERYLKFFKNYNGLFKLSGADAYNYCLLCEGKIDHIIDLELKPYDIIPLIPLIKNSGGIITNINGGENIDNGAIIVSRNSKLHNQILKAFNKKI